MARKPKAVSAPEAANDDKQRLIEALQFAAICTKDNDGKPAFVMIHDRWLMAENDSFGIGVYVDIALDLCPQADKFLAALQQCGPQFQLTQVEMGAVSIRSGNFRAVVPALSHDQLSTVLPDKAVALINDGLKEAFASCLKVMSKNVGDDRLIHHCLRMQANTVTATNGGLLLEYWHGIDLPGPLLIPKKTADTLAKINKPLAALGFSDQSVTFYFDDGCFLKTRLTSGEYPNIDRLWASVKAPGQAVWPELYVAIAAVKAFVDNDTIYFNAGSVGSHHTPELGASYLVPALPAGHSWSMAYWKAVEPHVKAVYVPAKGGSAEPLMFTGDKARGLIVGKHR